MKSYVQLREAQRRAREARETMASEAHIDTTLSFENNSVTMVVTYGEHTVTDTYVFAEDELHYLTDGVLPGSELYEHMRAMTMLGIERKLSRHWVLENPRSGAMVTTSEAGKTMQLAQAKRWTSRASALKGRARIERASSEPVTAGCVPRKLTDAELAE